MKRKFFVKSDIILIIMALTLSAAGAWAYSARPAEVGEYAEIYYNSELIKTVDMTEHTEMEFVLPQNENVVFHTDGNGRIRFERSDCPDKICVHSGWLWRSGEVAACLPNGFVLKIISPNNAQDVIIGG